MLRKFLLFSLIILIVLTIFKTPGYSKEQNIKVSVDNSLIAFDVQPIIKNNRTMVPFRPIAEKLDVKVAWISSANTIDAHNNTTTISLQINNKYAKLNGKIIELDMPPLLLNGRTFVPLRFFSEAFGCDVNWNASENKIDIISSTKKDIKVTGFYALGNRKTSSWTNLFKKPYPDNSIGNTDVIDVLALGWYSIDKEGVLLTSSPSGWQKPQEWQNVFMVARKYNLTPEMVIHLTNSERVITDLISNQEAINKAINSILAEARLYRSVNLDFEGLGWDETEEQLINTKKNFSNFITLLSNKLHSANIKLTLTLHPPNSAYKGYDFEDLAKNVDEIIIMAYDYGPSPEPMSLVEEAIKMTMINVPAEKLMLGISIPNETNESISEKLNLVNKYQLKGIALWRLGLISDEIWETLRNYTHKATQ